MVAVGVTHVGEPSRPGPDGQEAAGSTGLGSQSRRGRPPWELHLPWPGLMSDVHGQVEVDARTCATSGARRVQVDVRRATATLTPPGLAVPRVSWASLGPRRRLGGWVTFSPDLCQQLKA